MKRLHKVAEHFGLSIEAVKMLTPFMLTCLSGCSTTTPLAPIKPYRVNIVAVHLFSSDHGWSNWWVVATDENGIRKKYSTADLTVEPPLVGDVWLCNGTTITDRIKAEPETEQEVP